MRATTPFWLDEPYAPRPPLAGDAECAVCVVGGGIGGVATAWHLAARGVRALVLEARTVASGASGRNGGFFLAGAAPMYDALRDACGRERAARVYRATLEGQRQMLAAAEEVGARGHFSLDGMLRLGIDAREAAAVRRHHAALAQDGLPGELVGPPATFHPKSATADHRHTVRSRPFGPRRRRRLRLRLADRAMPPALHRSCVLAWRRRRPVFRVERHERTH